MVWTTRVTSLLLAAGMATVGGAQVPTTTRPTTDTTRAGLRDSTRRDSTGRAMTAMRRDSAITPTADPARGVDAELRIALYEMLGQRYVPALARLQEISAAPVAMATSQASSGALRGRQDIQFLLAQSYWRLGMDQAFRQTAEPLASGAGSTRYAGLLRGQLMLDAYRHGDYARAISMAQQFQGTESRGLGALVAGLSYYQQGQWVPARTQFGTAQQAGAPYADFARYMDALAQLRADTAQTATALQSLQALAGSASGEFAEQVRLTAAQLAYEAERYDDAARLAGQIPTTSGLGAQALLTRAWALYKANQTQAAGEAFNQFATTYPQLPERDEARLMYAQALLQQKRTADASVVFRGVADSAKAEGSMLQGRTATAMADAARALVTARAAGLLFLADPSTGKTVALTDSAGSDRAVLAAAVNDAVPTAASTTTAMPDIVSLTDVDQRLGQAGASSQMLPRRVLYVPTSATNNRVEYAGRAQALYEADVSVALARFKVQSALEAQQRQLAMLQALSARLAADSAQFNAQAARIQAAQDSLSRLASRLDAAGSRLHQMFQAQLNSTRLLADENRQLIDSLQRTLSGAMSTTDREVIGLELQTAQSYRAVADIIEGKLDSAIAHHPVFAMRDSVRGHGERSRLTLQQTRDALASAQALISGEIARLQGGDGAAPYRSALASAEAQRTSAESQLVAVVSHELDARATELLADLRRDTEAAEFGSASAAFFQALDTGTTPAATGTTGSNETGTGASRGTAVATSRSPRK